MGVGTTKWSADGSTATHASLWTKAMGSSIAPSSSGGPVPSHPERGPMGRAQSANRTGNIGFI
jgi:hypothetical protein